MLSIIILLFFEKKLQKVWRNGITVVSLHHQRKQLNKHQKNNTMQVIKSESGKKAARITQQNGDFRVVIYQIITVNGQVEEQYHRSKFGISNMKSAERWAVKNLNN